MSCLLQLCWLFRIGCLLAHVLMDNRNDRWREIILTTQMWFIVQEVDSIQLKKSAERCDKTSIRGLIYR